MDDDLYPNDGTYFLPREPKEQRIARKKENAKVLESIDVITDLIKHLDDRIAFYASVDSIPAEVKVNPDQFLIMHNANEQTRNNLNQERELLISILDTYQRR